MPLLEYGSPDANPKVVALERSDSDVRLIFPPPPKWAGLVAVTTSAFAAGNLVFIAGNVILMSSQLTAGLPAPASSWLRPALIYAALAVLGLGNVVLIALHFWKWGSTPKVLQLTRQELIWSAPGFWKLSQRRYPATELQSFDVLPVRDIFGRRTSFKLRCRRKRGRSIVRYFSTRDSELPNRIERAFRERLHLPP